MKIKFLGVNKKTNKNEKDFYVVKNKNIKNKNIKNKI